MRDSISIGPSPVDEECAQVGQDDYSRRAKAELITFRNMIRRVLGEEPEGASLVIKSNPHDFGNYYDLECVFDDNNEAAIEYCFMLESKTPANWDEQAKRELMEFLKR